MAVLLGSGSCGLGCILSDGLLLGDVGELLIDLADPLAGGAEFGVMGEGPGEGGCRVLDFAAGSVDLAIGAGLAAGTPCPAWMPSTTTSPQLCQHLWPRWLSKRGHRLVF